VEVRGSHPYQFRRTTRKSSLPVSIESPAWVDLARCEGNRGRCLDLWFYEGSSSGFLQVEGYSLKRQDEVREPCAVPAACQAPQQRTTLSCFVVRAGRPRQGLPLIHIEIKKCMLRRGDQSEDASARIQQLANAEPFLQVTIVPDSRGRGEAPEQRPRYRL